MHQRSRVCLLALHVVTLNMLDVFITCNPCTRTSESLREILKKESVDGMDCLAAPKLPYPPLRSDLIGKAMGCKAELDCLQRV